MLNQRPGDSRGDSASLLSHSRRRRAPQPRPWMRNEKEALTLQEARGPPEKWKNSEPEGHPEESPDWSALSRTRQNLLNCHGNYITAAFLEAAFPPPPLLLAQRHKLLPKLVPSSLKLRFAWTCLSLLGEGSLLSSISLVFIVPTH